MTFNKSYPDDRSDNVEKLQEKIQNTLENISEAEASMAFSNEVEQQRILEKNQKREESIQSMRIEAKEEAAARKNGYK
ncbi:small acid-soluble spore protein (thioredoxin-like protein) [Peribacillus deserti]|uniref:Small, acid-soluble spore protein Tlp n=1 Tax=Peribacillus deserti TaxID=673318 RepID=A0ABS2QDZ2_9BACI|nr:small acid-soluble spore protein Tlp [Peribacillus deserti]MBM7691387.1 small acid-soluble spore protein (thioredoxin-like protein) [Peribacillus deserti]